MKFFEKVKTIFWGLFLISIPILIVYAIISGVVNGIHNNNHTKIYKIEENDFETIEVKKGLVYYFLDKEANEQIRTISKDSTYFYNNSDEEWLLYSVDYTDSKKKAKIPDDIQVIVPPHTMLGYDKISTYILSSKPLQEITLYGDDAKKRYVRKMYLRKASIVMEESTSLDELIPYLNKHLNKK